MNSDDTGGKRYYFIIPLKICPTLISVFLLFLPEVLERKLNEMETEKFNIKQMKDMFEQKAAQLATEIVGQYDTRELRLLCLWEKPLKSSLNTPLLVLVGFRSVMCKKRNSVLATCSN